MTLFELVFGIGLETTGEHKIFRGSSEVKP